MPRLSQPATDCKATSRKDMPAALHMQGSTDAHTSASSDSDPVIAGFDAAYGHQGIHPPDTGGMPIVGGTQLPNTPDTAGQDKLVRITKRKGNNPAEAKAVKRTKGSEKARTKAMEADKHCGDPMSHQEVGYAEVLRVGVEGEERLQVNYRAAEDCSRSLTAADAVAIDVPRSHKEDALPRGNIDADADAEGDTSVGEVSAILGPDVPPQQDDEGDRQRVSAEQPKISSVINNFAITNQTHECQRCKRNLAKIRADAVYKSLGGADGKWATWSCTSYPDEIFCAGCIVEYVQTVRSAKEPAPYVPCLSCDRPLNVHVLDGHIAKFNDGLGTAPENPLDAACDILVPWVARFKDAAKIKPVEEWHITDFIAYVAQHAFGNRSELRQSYASQNWHLACSIVAWCKVMGVTVDSALNQIRSVSPLTMSLEQLHAAYARPDLVAIQHAYIKPADCTVPKIPQDWEILWALPEKAVTYWNMVISKVDDGEAMRTCFHSIRARLRGYRYRGKDCGAGNQGDHGAVNAEIHLNQFLLDLLHQPSLAKRLDTVSLKPILDYLGQDMSRFIRSISAGLPSHGPLASIMGLHVALPAPQHPIGSFVFEPAIPARPLTTLDDFVTAQQAIVTVKGLSTDHPPRPAPLTVLQYDQPGFPYLWFGQLQQYGIMARGARAALANLKSSGPGSSGLVASRVDFDERLGCRPISGTAPIPFALTGTTTAAATAVKFSTAEQSPAQQAAVAERHSLSPPSLSRSASSMHTYADLGANHDVPEPGSIGQPGNTVTPHLAETDTLHDISNTNTESADGGNSFEKEINHSPEGAPVLPLAEMSHDTGYTADADGETDPGDGEELDRWMGDIQQQAANLVVGQPARRQLQLPFSDQMISIPATPILSPEHQAELNNLQSICIPAAIANSASANSFEARHAGVDRGVEEQERRECGSDDDRSDESNASTPRVLREGGQDDQAVSLPSALHTDSVSDRDGMACDACNNQPAQIANDFEHDPLESATAQHHSNAFFYSEQIRDYDNANNALREDTASAALPDRRSVGVDDGIDRGIGGDANAIRKPKDAVPTDEPPTGPSYHQTIQQVGTAMSYGGWARDSASQTGASSAFNYGPSGGIELATAPTNQVITPPVGPPSSFQSLGPMDLNKGLLNAQWTASPIAHGPAETTGQGVQSASAADLAPHDTGYAEQLQNGTLPLNAGDNLDRFFTLGGTAGPAKQGSNGSYDTSNALGLEGTFVPQFPEEGTGHGDFYYNTGAPPGDWHGNLSGVVDRHSTGEAQQGAGTGLGSYGMSSIGAVPTMPAYQPPLDMTNNTPIGYLPQQADDYYGSASTAGNYQADYQDLGPAPGHQSTLYGNNYPSDVGAPVQQPYDPAGFQSTPQNGPQNGDVQIDPAYPAPGGPQTAVPAGHSYNSAQGTFFDTNTNYANQQTDVPTAYNMQQPYVYGGHAQLVIGQETFTGLDGSSYFKAAVPSFNGRRKSAPHELPLSSPNLLLPNPYTTPIRDQLATSQSTGSSIWPYTPTTAFIGNAQVAQPAVAQYHLMGGQPRQHTGYMTGVPGYGQHPPISNSAELGNFSAGTVSDFQAQSAPAHTTAFNPVTPAFGGTSSTTTPSMSTPSSAPHSRIVHPRPLHHKHSPFGFPIGRSVYSYGPLASPTPQSRAQLYARGMAPIPKKTDTADAGPSFAPSQPDAFGSQYSPMMSPDGETTDLRDLYQRPQDRYTSGMQESTERNKRKRSDEGNGYTRDKGKGTATGRMEDGWA